MKNLVNPRKEFYRDVELEEIEGFVKERGLSAQFIRYPEARAFRQTLAARTQESAGEPDNAQEKFSEHLFQRSELGVIPPCVELT